MSPQTSAFHLRIYRFNALKHSNTKCICVIIWEDGDKTSLSSVKINMFDPHIYKIIYSVLVRFPRCINCNPR